MQNTLESGLNDRSDYIPNFTADQKNPLVAAHGFQMTLSAKIDKEPKKKLMNKAAAPMSKISKEKMEKLKAKQSSHIRHDSIAYIQRSVTEE